MAESALRIINPGCHLRRVLTLKPWEHLLPATSRLYSTRDELITCKQTDKLKLFNRLSCLKQFHPCQKKPLFPYSQTSFIAVRSYSSSSGKNENKEEKLTETDNPEQVKKLSLFQKFKIMYKKYWYVLVPVHIITSIGWFGGFYYLAKSGVDVVALLESFNFSEVIIRPIRDSSAGYVAIAYALYKIATPLRYTVTLGGTTISINYLTKWGLIKPIPPKERLKEMYQEKKDNLKERRDVFTGEIKMKRDQFKEKGEAFMRDLMDQGKKDKEK